MKYTTILLDLVDTLIDTQANSRECLKEIYRDYNISDYYPTFDDFLSVYMNNRNILWSKYSKGEIDKQTLIDGRFVNPFRDFAEITLQDTRRMNDDFLSRVVYKETHIEGAGELLEYLKPKYQIIVLSNGFTELQYRKIESAGFTPFFDGVVLSDKVGVNKPHPVIFSYALQEAGVNPEDVIMIGDNLQTDIIGAKNSGIDQLWFNPKNENPNDVRPTYTVGKLLEIKDIL